MTLRELRGGIRVGVVAHPGAGSGSTVIERVLEELFSTLGEVTVVIVSGGVEAAVAAHSGVFVEQVCRTSEGGGLGIAGPACDVVRRGVDVMVAVGGDGTLASVANTLAPLGAHAPPLVGIGTGSANVGPLVTMLGRDVAGLDWHGLTETSVDGVRYTVDEVELGIGFNDIVFSNTFFGTLDGVRVDLDARAMLCGRRVASTPVSVCGADVRVYKNGTLVLDGRNKEIAQVVVCPVNEATRFAGTAASGLLSWGPYVGCPAVLAASSTVLIRTQLTLDDLTAVEPLQLHHVAFGRLDEITVLGLAEGAILVCDGTPMVELGPTQQVGLTLAPGAVQVMRKDCCR